MAYKNIIDIEQKTIVSNQLFVQINGSSITTVDNVVNALTVLLENEREIIPLQNRPATDYLKHLNVIEEVDQDKFKIINRKACSQISDKLSDYAESFIATCSSFIKSL